MVDFDQLKRLLNFVREHDLSELEIEQDGLRVKVRTSAGPLPVPAAAAQPGSAPAEADTAAGVASLQAARVAAPSEGDEVELAVMKSPIVGTFYRSAEPASSAFVDIGSVVKKGQVLCIIEAMKLMNEIDSEYDGEIVAIYVENGQAVQYGERLFAIKTK